MFTPSLAIIMLTAFASALVETKIRIVLGIAPQFSLAVLIAAGPFIGLGELLLIVAGTWWFVNWQPAASTEMLFFFLIPLAFRFRERVLPWQPWFTNALGVLSASLAFPAITAFRGVAAEPVSWFVSGAATALVGAGAYGYFSRTVGERGRATTVAAGAAKRRR